MAPVKISYYSDVLCIWAFFGQRRVDQLVQDFGDQITIDVYYCSVFPDAWGKIETNWRTEGRFEGFNRHINDVATNFPHIEINPNLWLGTRPRTSASAHMFLKAIEMIEQQEQAAGSDPAPYSRRLSTRAAWAVRRAFFQSAQDISNWKILGEIADGLGIDTAKTEEKIHSSEAVAQLAADYDLSQKLGVQGSPTFIMNNGRQKLFGNVGYRLLEANVQELLHSTAPNEASWC